MTISRSEWYCGDVLGRVCKLGLDRGKAGLSPVRHTTHLVEDPSNQLRIWTGAGPLHRSGSLQTRPRCRPLLAQIGLGAKKVWQGWPRLLIWDELAQRIFAEPLMPSTIRLS